MMLFVKILMLILGLSFAFLGYFIFFKKKYTLINGFIDDYNAGRKTEKYARRVGLIEFIIVIILLCAAVLLIILI